MGGKSFLVPLWQVLACTRIWLILIYKVDARNYCASRRCCVIRDRFSNVDHCRGGFGMRWDRSRMLLPLVGIMRLLPAGAGWQGLLVIAIASGGANHSIASTLPTARVHTVYVSPMGNDSALGATTRVGDPEGPVKTLARARDLVRAFRRKTGKAVGPVNVILLPGIYRLETPFQLSAEDSGTDDSPVVYCAQDGARVLLTGAQPVGPLHPVIDQRDLARLQPVARASVWSADIKALGTKALVALPRRGLGGLPAAGAPECYFNHQPMPLARWPNSGFASLGAVPDGPKGARFSIGPRASHWRDEPDLWAEGYWYWDWSFSAVPVDSIDLNGQISIKPPLPPYGLRPGQRIRVINALSELDSPGEWYLDRVERCLFFWPPSIGGEVELSVTSSLIQMQDVSCVTFSGFIMEACTGTAVIIRGGSQVQIKGCTIRGTGNRAVEMSGAGHRVDGCEISGSGEGAIWMQGGDRSNLVKAGLSVTNTHIFNCGRLAKTNQAAIWVEGVGNEVIHNKIEYGPHMAIYFKGNDHLIEFNEISNVCMETGDSGAIYVGRDWTSQGTLVRFNFLHDINGPGRLGSKGVYLDDQASGIQVRENIFLRIHEAVFIHAGSDNHVEGNLFLASDPPLRLVPQVNNPSMESQLRQAAGLVSTNLYQQRYPELRVLLRQTPGVPARNVIKGNIFSHSPLPLGDAGLSWTLLNGANCIDCEGTLSNPAFSLPGVVPPSMVFQIPAASPAILKGFRNLPFSEMGLKPGVRPKS